MQDLYDTLKAESCDMESTAFIQVSQPAGAAGPGRPGRQAGRQGQLGSKGGS